MTARLTERVPVLRIGKTLTPVFKRRGLRQDFVSWEKPRRRLIPASLQEIPRLDGDFAAHNWRNELRDGLI
ncbi:MAG: hypothetical protein MZW92_06525 [Comamonadaceae bacterium]|nr:hypothetical protein [Comamonadaceae bacterium]